MAKKKPIGERAQELARNYGWVYVIIKRTDTDECIIIPSELERWVGRGAQIRRVYVRVHLREKYQTWDGPKVDAPIVLVPDA